MRGKEKGRDDGEQRGRLRNGSSDRDFNVEHTRFESIGPLRLARQAVDMVQQLPPRFPPAIVVASPFVCLAIIFVTGDRP